MKVLLFGNSHLAYFWKGYKDFLDKRDDLDIRIACTNYLQNNWQSGENFFKRFNYNSSVTYGEKTYPKPVDFKDFHIETGDVVKLIIIGYGIYDEPIYGIWGGFHNCKLPYHSDRISNSEGVRHILRPMSSSELCSIYTEYFRKKADFLISLINLKFIENVVWVVSPQLGYDPAKYAVGITNIESGNYRWHQQIAYKAFEKVFGDYGLDRYIIDPNKICTTDNNFLYSKYEVDPQNNHASDLYFLTVRSDIEKWLNIDS